MVTMCNHYENLVATLYSQLVTAAVGPCILFSSRSVSSLLYTLFQIAIAMHYGIVLYASFLAKVNCHWQKQHAPKLSPIILCCCYLLKGPWKLSFNMILSSIWSSIWTKDLTQYIFFGRLVFSGQLIVKLLDLVCYWVPVNKLQQCSCTWYVLAITEYILLSNLSI